MIARALLALIFLVAAVGKLLDPAGSRRALEEFGISADRARVGGVALPVTELAVAIALLLQPTAVWGAIGALALLIVFIIGVGRAISQGKRPDCHCFGQIHSEPAGRSTLLRNVALSAPAILIIAAGPGPSMSDSLANLTGIQAALVATAVVACLLLVAVVELWRDRRRLKYDLEMLSGAAKPAGLPRSAEAPEFDLKPVRGQARTLADLMMHARPAILVFVSTTCGPCLEMLPSLGRWQQSLSGSVSVVAIFSGESTEVERLAAEYGLESALLQDYDEAFQGYELRATPSAVLVDSDGLIGSSAAEGAAAIEALIRTALAQAPPPELVLNPS